jgi:hypothetical protein
MRRILLLSVVIGFALAVSGLCIALELATEAELAQVIEAPMHISVPADAPAHGGPEPDEPSRGQFIWSNEGGAGHAKFEINIPQSGTYAIWGRVIAWDGSSDSFWVTWEPADPPENSQITDNKDFRWSVEQGNVWQWDRIEVWADDDSHTDREWVIPAGPTTLTIYTRESNTMLDCIFITDNLSSDEAEANPRTPTDADLLAASVEPADKLAVTWGAIRSAW